MNQIPQEVCKQLKKKTVIGITLFTLLIGTALFKTDK